MVETVNKSLYHVFRLDRERPHELGRFAVRVIAKTALHLSECVGDVRWILERIEAIAGQAADLAGRDG